ncbi:MAG: DUF4118 domain-containing protein, partial [Acidimicrobiales bacterium]
MHDGRRRWPVRVGVALLAPALVAAALVPLRAHVLNTNLALVLVVAVLGAAVAGGRVAGVVGALSAALSYDLFLTVPYGSFKIERGDDIETTVLLALIGLIAGELVERARRSEAAAIARRRDLERIRRRAELAAGGERPGRLIEQSAEELTELLDLKVCRYVPEPPPESLPVFTHDAIRVPGDMDNDARAAPWPCRCGPTGRISATSCSSYRRSRSDSAPPSMSSTPPSPWPTNSAWRCSATGGPDVATMTGPTGVGDRGAGQTSDATPDAAAWSTVSAQPIPGEKAFVSARAALQRRGTLRVYLGAAPGVGKTFAMLNEGRRRHERGTDVVVGYVETHGRAHTAEQIGDLEVVPRRVLTYRGAALEEMDLDAVLARRPDVALIDELAHTNVPGSKHAKRWEDVAVLLDAGIDVISTLNIQHLESINDVVERITG